MSAKLDFYTRYGVEEYNIYDPDRLVLTGYLRTQVGLIEIKQMAGHVSPRLGIRFEMGEKGLTVLRPDGEPFLPAEDIARQMDQQRQRADEAIDRANQERERADRLQRELDQLRREPAPPRPGGV
jgi:hypothetical protein